MPIRSPSRCHCRWWRSDTNCLRFIIDATSLLGAADLLWIDFKDQYPRAAGYVDRILRAEKPANFPVQAPTKYELRYQSQDRQGARPYHATNALGRGDEAIE